MARRLTSIVLGVAVCVASVVALAAELDAKGEATAKEATRLYKQGQYEEAAKLYAQLSVDHPDMPIFERNMGACFYYLKKPEPALSNLRNYLNHKKDISADDRAVVDRWIAEMEAVRAQSNAAAATPVVMPPEPAAAQPSPPPLPVAAPPPAPIVAPLPMVVTPAATAPAAQPAGVDLAAVPAQPEPATDSAPFYKRWWFWGTVGAVVAAGTVTAVVLATRPASTNIPETALGNQGAFQ